MRLWQMFSWLDWGGGFGEEEPIERLNAIFIISYQRYLLSSSFMTDDMC